MWKLYEIKFSVAVNQVLLELSNTYDVLVAFYYFQGTMAEWSSYNRDGVVHKS